MKKWSFFIVVLFVLASLVGVTSCGKKKPVDKRKEVAQLVQKGNYRLAKQHLITLRGNYPNDKMLQELERKVDIQLAQEAYKKYFEEARKKDTWKGWIEAMIRIKKVENSDKKMVNEQIRKAAEKCIDAGAKQLKDGALLGLLKKLEIRYQVISHKDRLMYITMFHKEGRFPLKDWKDTFVSKYPELMDEAGEKFLGYPHPTPEQIKANKKQ